MMVETLCRRCHTTQVWPAGARCTECKEAAAAAAPRTAR